MVSDAVTHDARWPRRYTLAGLCFFGTFICYIDRVNISLAAIAMQDQYGWSDTTKGYVLSSFFIGYMATQVAGGALANRLGGKLVLGFAVLWWSVFTILTPPAAAFSLGILIVTRILMGIGEGMAFPSMYNLFGRWIPAAEKSRVVAVTFSGISLGTLSALVLTGPIIERFGWPSVFYIFGVLGIVWFFFWQRLVTNTPQTHPTISAAELALIEASTGPAEKADHIPWKGLFSSLAIWAIIINHFCANWGFYVLLAWLPSYFKTAWGMSLTGAGLASAAPWLSMFIMTNVGAWIADAQIRRGISVTYVRKQQQTIGLVGAAIFLYLVRGLEPGQATLAIVYMCCSLGLLSFVLSGFATNHLDVAPRYADVLLGITNTAGTIPGIIGVFITGYLVEQTGSFDVAFALAAGIFIFGAAVFLLFATGKKLFD
ncbi:MAG: ACS family sodium-dependent inorganic phosphate cotransporter [Gammaproteobacteria bacterium]|jgi:ACS family sodium-dependent inorganic phosphate cotransporter